MPSSNRRSAASPHRYLCPWLSPVITYAFSQGEYAVIHRTVAQMHTPRRRRASRCRDHDAEARRAGLVTPSCRQPAHQVVGMRLAGEHVSAARVPRRHVGPRPVPTHRTRVCRTLPGRGAPALAIRRRRGMRHRAARRGAAGLPAGVDLPGQRAVPGVHPVLCHRTLVSGLVAHQRLLAAAHPGGADPQPRGGRCHTAPARAGHSRGDIRGSRPLRRPARPGC